MEIKLTLAVRQKQWEEVETRLRPMSLIVAKLKNYVPTAFCDFVARTETLVHGIVQSVSSCLTYVKKVDFFAPISMDELNDSLTKIRDNGSVQYYGDSSESKTSYDDVIRSLCKNLESLQPRVLQLWNQSNYEPLVQLFDNLKQGQKLVNHGQLYNTMAKELNHHSNIVKTDIQDLITQSKKILEAKSFDKLEAFMLKYSKISKAFQRIILLFMSSAYGSGVLGFRSWILEVLGPGSWVLGSFGVFFYRVLGFRLFDFGVIWFGCITVF